ncbi:MAG: SMI1/KNR4 family protein [Planctomycetia bacterium]|nr:SMI1/KNR4 family protein [Planctomycetia bacterium]
MGRIFADFDTKGFWKPSSYAMKEYVGVPLTDEIVADVEYQLGYNLPASYIELMRFQNGGIPCRTNHRTKQRTTWSHNHIAISGIYSIGSDKPCSLCGEFGSPFWIAEWCYPAIGVYFADCPSAGHDMLCLDYRECGPTGEPEVVHVDQEWDYKIVFVAESFEAFIRGLEDDSAFDENAKSDPTDT